MLGLAALLPLGCGKSNDLTVQGHTLTVAEQNYATDRPMGCTTSCFFCGSLDSRGQIEVILTDFALCSQVHGHNDNNKIFHTTHENNLRLIFPLTPNLMINPKVHTFTVGTADCANGTTGDPKTNAIAIFSTDNGMHGQGSGTRPYDFQAMADSGTITITNYDKNGGVIAGSFDLTFGSDHLSGSIGALFCNGLTPDYAQ